MALELKAPIEVQVELTQECNQYCHHCYNYWRTSENPNSYVHLTYERIQHVVRELSSNEILAIYVTGGEPFIRKKALFFLLDSAKKAGIGTSINSNFSLVRPNDIDKLSKEYYDTPVLVSLLSSEPDLHERLTKTPKGTFAKVLQNIRLAVSKGVPININMVLMPQNINGIRDLAELSKDIGARTFCATKVLPPPHVRTNDLLLSPAEVLQSLNELIKIEKELKIDVDILQCYPKCMLLGTEGYQRFHDHACVAGITTATIGADGEVRPCSHIPTSYGNIFHETLTEIWKKMNTWRNGEYIPVKCRNCQIITTCNGGCRMNSLTTKLTDMDVYATPEKLLGTTKDQLFPEKNHDTQKNNFLDQVILSPKVKFREENFGSIILQPNPWGVMLINKSTTIFLKKNKTEMFTFEDFVIASRASNKIEQEKVKTLYVKLLKKQIFISPYNLNEKEVK